MILWFETHSISTDNERGIASGHLDPPLSERGAMLAAEVHARYAARDLRAVYTSDLVRAVDTARIAFSGTALPQIVDTRLRECDYGSMSGCTTAEMDQVRARYIEEPFPGGESIRQVVRRTATFLDDVQKDGKGNILVIGHRATWYAFEHLLAGRDLTAVVTGPWTWQPGWQYAVRPTRENRTRQELRSVS